MNWTDALPAVLTGFLLAHIQVQVTSIVSTWRRGRRETAAIRAQWAEMSRTMQPSIWLTGDGQQADAPTLDSASLDGLTPESRAAYDRRRQAARTEQPSGHREPPEG